jgi:hypothetical protein
MASDAEPKDGGGVRASRAPRAGKGAAAAPPAPRPEEGQLLLLQERCVSKAGAEGFKER